MGGCCVVVLVSFLCLIPVIKMPHCSIAVISNPPLCDVYAFKPTVSGKTKLRHQQYQHSLHADHAVWTLYMAL